MAIAVQESERMIMDFKLEYLLERGVEAGEVQEFPWGRFTGFRDPDGNEWAVQQLPRPLRLSGRRLSSSQLSLRSWPESSSRSSCSSNHTV